MQFGTTPYRGANREETFEQILHGGLKVPDHPPVSKECKNLLRKLLCPDPRKRLGAERGAADVKAHKWFKGVNMVLIRNETPPIIPQIDYPTDTRNFRHIEDTPSPQPDSPLDPSTANPDDPFKEFKPVRPLSFVRISSVCNPPWQLHRPERPPERPPEISVPLTRNTSRLGSSLNKKDKREKKEKKERREKDNSSDKKKNSSESSERKEKRGKDKKK
jgi:serine/threonine protein kinase